MPQSFDSWLYGAVEFVIRDHVRKRYGRTPRTLRVDGPRPTKRDINSHAGPLEEERFDATYLRQLGMTARLTLAEIFAYVDETFTARRRTNRAIGESRSISGQFVCSHTET